MPLHIRSFGPLDMPFHDLGHEFTHDVSNLTDVKFVVTPYPPNKLIREV